MLKGRNIRSPLIPIDNFDIETCYYLYNDDRYLETFELSGVLNSDTDREGLVKQVLDFEKFCRTSISDKYINQCIRNENNAILFVRNTDGILLGVCCFEYIDNFIYIHGICSLTKGKNIGQFLINKLQESFVVLKEYGFESIKLKSQSNLQLKEWYKKMGFKQENEDLYNMIYSGGNKRITKCRSKKCKTKRSKIYSRKHTKYFQT